ncbi:type II toxin-antitoxin system VapC family toxin [Marinihelvus fidelis]|uniref:type II toxin-antitoxin system VapC family toxin n=1 Tax=Marinihelvus fidelis TaxID=2613842 RepID=UPI001782F5A1|nr:type II toxin-antitoxin system VapC family toxin [Marinihelvus fidelis]
MNLLIDTNVLSEIRKGSRANPRLLSWLKTIDERSMFTSVLTMGEILKGVELLKHRDRRQYNVLSLWHQSLVRVFEDRLVPVTLEVSSLWARLQSIRTLPVIDGYLAATALTHGMSLVTRNTRDFKGTGVPLVNPFKHSAS